MRNHIILALFQDQDRDITFEPLQANAVNVNRFEVLEMWLLKSKFHNNPGHINYRIFDIDCTIYRIVLTILIIFVYRHRFVLLVSNTVFDQIMSGICPVLNVPLF